MKNIITKLIIPIIHLLFINGCGSSKYFSNKILINDFKVYENKKELNNSAINYLILSKPNKKILSIPLGLKIYNLSNKFNDSSFNIWVNKNKKRKNKIHKLISSKQLNQLKKYSHGIKNWLENNSEHPAYFNDGDVNKSKNRIQRYYKNIGYFNVKVNVKKNLVDKNKINLSYLINTGERYLIDSISDEIESNDVKNVYNKGLINQKIKKGNPFTIKKIDEERKRLINLFRDNGIYNFEQSSIKFYASIDSSGIDKMIPLKIKIENPKKRINDTLTIIDYKIFKIKKINLYVESNKKENEKNKFSDSLVFKNYKIFTSGKLKYNPKILTAGIYLKNNQIYSDSLRKLTYQSINNLKNFKYPGIYYTELENENNTLKASIFLTPKEKFSLGFDLDLSHSNIQDFGIDVGGSLSIRNVFRGSEILEIGLKNNLGASRDIAKSNDDFFNILELSANTKISIPRIIIPFYKKDMISLKMNPKTEIIFGTGLQKNIGLDKQFFSTNFQYYWNPNKNKKITFKLIDFEFINNKNINNYFNVYKNSYDILNNIASAFNKETYIIDQNGNLIIPSGVETFIKNVLNEETEINYENPNYLIINNLKERLDRLTSNNLILGSSINLNYNNQESYFDENFFQFRWKIEWIGTLLNAILKGLNKSKNSINQHEIDGVAPSQYFKTELDYIKHWRIGTKKIVAFHFFSGIALPYGNSRNIPFSRSFFSGGSNDNRAWKAYKLGPGSSNNINEFNEANFKLSLNLEYRYLLYGKLNGAFFIDMGNIWNIFDDIEDKKFEFNGINDLNEIAIGSGFGLRYDFDFFVLRFDTGFKTHNPALEKNTRWLSEFTLKKAVFNIGINYPF